MTIRRDWRAEARPKVDAERRCRACGKTERELRRLGRSLEAAHVMGRGHDRKATIYTDEESIRIEAELTRAVIVRAIRIVPLCGPATDPSTCHAGLDNHRRDFSLLGKLTPEEEAQAVLDAGGLEQARIRIAPSEYPSKIVNRA